VNRSKIRLIVRALVMGAAALSTTLGWKVSSTQMAGIYAAAEAVMQVLFGEAPLAPVASQATDVVVPPSTGV